MNPEHYQSKAKTNNYYEILEVSTNATEEEIYEAFSRAKNAYSGQSIALYSLLTEDECKAILEMVEEAYSILGDPAKRASYDEARGFNKNKEREQEQSPTSPLAKAVSQHAESIKNTSSMNYDDYKISHKEAEVSKVSARNRYALEYKIDEEMENEIETCTEFSGEFLKRIREYKGVSVERLADMTKISKTFIRNIEAEEKGNLPAHVYVRGFIYQYAKTLKLNPDLVATSYIKRIKQDA